MIVAVLAVEVVFLVKQVRLRLILCDRADLFTATVSAALPAAGVGSLVPWWRSAGLLALPSVVLVVAVA